YRAVLTNRGAGLIVLELKNYRHGDSGRVQMLGPDSEPVPVVMSNVSGFSDRNLVYRVEGSDLNLTAGGSQTLTFSASVPGRGEIVKEFTFHADRYDFDLKVKINGVPQFGLDREYIFAWLPGLPSSEEN